jgi:hypothetical protein
VLLVLGQPDAHSRWPADRALAVSVVLIAAGAGGAAVVEAGTPSFSALGAAAFALSSVTEATRAALSEMLLNGSGRLNSAQACARVCAVNGIAVVEVQACGRRACAYF